MWCECCVELVHKSRYYNCNTDRGVSKKGPDRFIDMFYLKAWPVIKNDLMAAIIKLWVENDMEFGKLN